jgi:PAS domain S-box-containing protein
MGTSGSTPNVTREDIRSVFSRLDEPCTPLTVAEVAEKLECTKRTAQHNLETLAELGELQTKQIDGQSKIWWRSGDGSESAGQQSDLTEFNRFVSAVEDYAIFMLDPHGTIVSWNEGAKQIKGYAKREILGEHLSTFYTDADIEDGMPDANLETAAAEGRIEDKGWRVRKDGSRFWADVVITAIHDDDGTLQGFTKVTRDITEQRYKQLQEEQTQLLERIATGAPLEECLSALCASISRLNPGTKASILLADAEREAFQRSIAPDLCPSWAEGLEGTPINDLMSGTCGEAVFRGQPVTCEDVTTDDRWAEDWRNLCIVNGVMAGHSVPIHDADGDPLGSFMLCFDEPNAPTEWEHRLADFGTHIARIAIERERSRRALHDSEERLRLATDAAEMGIWEIDCQSDAPAVRSPRHDEIFGYEEPIEDWTFEGDSLDHVHPDDRERIEAGFEKALKTGDWETECRIIRADGEQRWIAAHAEVYDDNGEAARVIGTVEDITERKERERELERTRDLLVKTERIADVGGWEIDPASRDVFWTDYLFDLLEFPADEEPSLEEALDVYHEDDRPAVKQAVEVALDTGEPFDIDARYWTGSGELRWLRVQGEPETVDSDITTLRGAVQDITERKERERDLDQYRAVTHAVNDAIITIDETSTIRSVNPAVKDIFGYDPEELVGERLTVLMAENLTDRHLSAFGNYLDSGERTLEWDYVEMSGRHRDGSEIPLALSFSEVEHGGERLFTGVVRDVTERKQRERELTQQHEQIEDLKDRLLETSPTGIVVLDSTNEVTLANDRAADILGMTREELIGLPYDTSQFNFVDRTGEPLSDGDLPFERLRTTGDSVFGVEVGLTPNGHRIWLSINATPLSDEQAHEPPETVVAFEDITDHKRANDALEHLNDTSRELMNADTQAISERAADITQEVLAIPYASLWRYDETTGDLQLHTASTASGIDPASIRYPEQFEERAWQTFVSTELDASNEFPPVSDSAPSEEPLRSEVIVPLGRHGVICAGSLSPGAFDETTIDLAETVAATIETALDRAGDEQALARQNEELTRLDRINSIIREIDQALVQAETREEIDRVVCEQLSASDLYEFAWIGETDPGTATIVPREWAGIDPGYLDQLTITTDETPTGQGPIGTAVKTREPQVVQDIITASRFAPWREHTLAQDVRSCLSIPLVYNDALYGVLTVYAEQPLTNERHHDVLAELGETIAHAISSAETKQALQTDSVVELSLQVREPDTILSRLAQQVSCQIEFEGLISHSAETAQVFVTTRGASADEICTAATESLAIETMTMLSESEDGCRFKLVMTDPPLAAVLIDQDAEIRQLTLDADGVTAVVDLPTTKDVRPVIETVQTTFPETELVSRRTCPRSREPLHTCRVVYEESLTDRQQETLRTAYLSGFFESPRGTTGQELAEAMDVSQPTFVQHLRAGQRNLFEMLFDGSE